MEQESKVSQAQCMKFSVSLSKTELISVCVCVMSEPVVKLEDGPAVCFHFKLVKSFDVVERPPTG